MLYRGLVPGRAGWAPSKMVATSAALAPPMCGRSSLPAVSTQTTKAACTRSCGESPEPLPTACRPHSTCQTMVLRFDGQGCVRMPTLTMLTQMTPEEVGWESSPLLLSRERAKSHHQSLRFSSRHPRSRRQHYRPPSRSRAFAQPPAPPVPLAQPAPTPLLQPATPAFIIAPLPAAQATAQQTTLPLLHQHQSPPGSAFPYTFPNSLLQLNAGSLLSDFSARTVAPACSKRNYYSHLLNISINPTPFSSVPRSN
jgi:hypothetical protein